MNIFYLSTGLFVSKQNTPGINSNTAFISAGFASSPPTTPIVNKHYISAGLLTHTRGILALDPSLLFVSAGLSAGSPVIDIRTTHYLSGGLYINKSDTGAITASTPFLSAGVSPDQFQHTYLSLPLYLFTPPGYETTVLNLFIRAPFTSKWYLSAGLPVVKQFGVVSQLSNTTFVTAGFTPEVTSTTLPLATNIANLYIHTLNLEGEDDEGSYGYYICNSSMNLFIGREVASQSQELLLYCHAKEMPTIDLYALGHMRVNSGLSFYARVFN